jgi:fibrillarin-like rRNA methylase
MVITKVQTTEMRRWNPMRSEIEQAVLPTAAEQIV